MTDSVIPDWRLIAIPPADDVEMDQLVRWCLDAAAGGATAVQLRLKNRPAGHVLGVAERIDARLAVPLYINDRADVARMAGVAGVHIGADDLPPAAARAVVPRPGRVGISVGTADEAARAMEVDADYWSIGPFFATESKADAGRALRGDGFRALARLAPPGMPVIAIGGITVDRLPEVLGAGAVGVAVIRGIFDGPDVVAATRALRSALDAALDGD